MAWRRRKGRGRFAAARHHCEGVSCVGEGANEGFETNEIIDRSAGLLDLALNGGLTAEPLAWRTGTFGPQCGAPNVQTQFVLDLWMLSLYRPNRGYTR